MNKIILGVVALVLIVGGVAIYQKSQKPDAPVGAVNFEKESFVSGLYAGDNRQFSVDADGEVLYRLGTGTITSTSTLTVAQSGKTFFLTTNNSTYTLPPVSDGLNFRFVVGGALPTGNALIDSFEGDNIDGTLIVAGAVVDCRGEDQINFITDGEQIGDYVELYSNGSKWFIGDSGVLTSAKMTCTDPS